MSEIFGNDKEINDTFVSEHQAFVSRAKSVLCIALLIVSVVGSVFSFRFSNSKYLEAFLGFKDGTSNLLPVSAYMLMNIAAYICLGVFAFLCFGMNGRRKRLEDARASYRRNGSGYLDVSKERVSVRNISRLETVLNVSRVFTVIFAVLAMLVFVSLYFVSGVPRAAIEMSKSGADRTNGNLRVIVDCIGQAMFTFSLCLGIMLIPVILKGYKRICPALIAVLLLFSGLAIIHYAFFFFGNITAHPSPEDLSAMLVPLIIAGFAGLYIFDFRRNRLLKTFNRQG